MRKEDLKELSNPYTDNRGDVDRRFHQTIGADVPSAGTLINEILNDLDMQTFGVRWWSIPDEERILISDYLYQCIYGIETNLGEAKLHYLEWLDARDKENNRIADVVSISASGEPNIKMPPSNAPIDDLTNRLEALHICGFFRAIGSSLDCVGAAIIGVLALNTRLRRSDIGTAEKALSNLVYQGTLGSQLQLDFYDFFRQAKASSGANDWLTWTNQYRNMLIHRGRLLVQHQLTAREHSFYDAKGKIIPRALATTHLSKYPDRTDVEGWIKGSDIALNEDAEITLNGIFQSCRNFEELICKELVSIWQQRRNNPLLLEQPVNQWNDVPRPCNFNGYDTTAEPHGSDLGVMNPVIKKRMLAASVFDHQRQLWANSRWK